MLIRHAFETNEQDDLTMLVGQSSNRPFEFAQLPRGRRIGGGTERSGKFLDIDSALLPERPKAHARKSVPGCHR